MTTQTDYHPGQIRQLRQVQESEAFGHIVDPTAQPAKALHWAHRGGLINIKLIDKRTAKLALTDRGRAILDAHKEAIR